VDAASSHIYALAWMPSAAAAMSIQTCRAREHAERDSARDDGQLSVACGRVQIV